MGCIYLLTCRVSGKVYVGQTTRKNAKYRYRSEWGCIKRKVAKGQRLRPIESAMLKYGMEGFEFRDLGVDIPNEDLDALERFFICHYRSNELGVGYNCDNGGKQNWRPSDSTRKRLIERGIVRDWWHPAHGTFRGSATALERAFPCQNLERTILAGVGRGKHRAHLGWTCASAPWKKVKNGAPHVWSHCIHGVVVASAWALTRKFKEVRLIAWKLSALARGVEVGPYKGWTHVRAATDEEAKGCWAGEFADTHI